MEEKKTQEEIAQSIIDAIQRYEINEQTGEFIDKEVDNYVRMADEYLFAGGEKPLFFDVFIQKTLSDLKTTINGCIKARNSDKKKDDLRKYKEGYFNEIIQNANDVVWKTNTKNPVVEVNVSKSDNIYSVECSYPDKGFSLENIYGFCTRGNSDKKAENGQEGMYGIGIKSLFCFVDEFEIKSNIHIKVTSSKDKKLDEVKLDVNSEREQQDITVLSFKFTYNRGGENYHARFNTRKVADFIDSVYETAGEELDKYFLGGNDEEIVFDARALFFTELRGKRKAENSIKELIIKRDAIEILRLKSEEEILPLPSQEDRVVNKEIVKIVNVGSGNKYILVHFEEKQISIAFQCNQDQINMDRLYSTYFIGTYENERPLLGVKTGCLINTTAINSSRSGLERENEKEPEILNTIMEKGQETIKILCMFASKYEDVLDVLCQLLWIYRKQAEEIEKEFYPKYIFAECMEELEKSMYEWKFKEGYKYILKEEDGVDNITGKITKNKPPLSTEENIRELFEFYEENIRDAEPNIIIWKDSNFSGLTKGVQRLSRAIFEESGLWLCQVQTLPFLSGIQDLIIKRIGGSEFEKIQEYLYGISDNGKKLLAKQLIARYKVNECFDYMGKYSDKNISNWLFDTVAAYNQDEDYKCVMDEYESFYRSLKNLVREKIQKSNYYKSYHYNAYDDWWYDNYTYNCFYDVSVWEEDILALLKLISDQVLKIGICKDSYDSYNNMFVHNRGYNITLRNRPRTTKSWTGIFAYFGLDLLNRDMVTFDRFVAARSYIDNYNETVRDVSFKINYIRRCRVPSIKVSEISKIFKWLATYDLKKLSIRAYHGNENIVNLGEINFENQVLENTELIRFVKRIINEDVDIRIETIPIGKKKTVGYFTNIKEPGGIYLKKSAEDDFIKVGDVPKQEKKFLLIYSSYNDEQRILNEVLSHLKYDKDICSYVNNFIKTGNVRNLSSEMYNRFLKKKRLTYEYPFEFDEMEESIIPESLSIEDTYALLAGEMSYDAHCPICNQIPTLNVKGNDNNINSLEKRNSLIAMLVAKYKGNDIYIKILCCKSCFEEYKNSLTEAFIEDIEGENYKKLTLKSRIMTNCRSRDMVNKVLISQDNWRIIENFNKNS